MGDGKQKGAAEAASVESVLSYVLDAGIVVIDAGRRGEIRFEAINSDGYLYASGEDRSEVIAKAIKRIIRETEPREVAQVRYTRAKIHSRICIYCEAQFMSSKDNTSACSNSCRVGIYRKKKRERERAIANKTQ